MGCCGRRSQPIRPGNRTTVSSSRRTTQPVSSFVNATKVDGWALLMYLGRSTGYSTYTCGTRKYKFGRTARYLKQWVHPDDVECLMKQEQFRIVQPAAAKEETSEKPSPIEEAQEPIQDDITYTDRAAELADAAGVTVEEIAKVTGEARVTAHVVARYTKEVQQ